MFSMKGFAIIISGLLLCLAGFSALVETARAERRGVAVTLKDMQSERRIALVVGNAGYKSGRLANPLNDTRDVSVELKRAGFEVITVRNVTKRKLRKAVEAFGRKLKAGGVGLFYYAGHGMQRAGNNYLIPIGAEIREAGDIEDEGFALNRVLRRMGNAGNRLNIVMLDACRNNPYQSRFRSQSRGLATTRAPKGVVMIYATRPGDVADDGAGRNSPFTAAFVQEMKTPGRKLVDVYKNMVRAVSTATNERQYPWLEGVIEGDFYFYLPIAKAPVVAGPSRDEAFWQLISASTDATVFRSFISLYPDSRHAGNARRKLASLETSSQDAAARITAQQQAQQAQQDQAARKAREEAAARQKEKDRLAQQIAAAKARVEREAKKTELAKLETERRAKRLAAGKPASRKSTPPTIRQHWFALEKTGDVEKIRAFIARHPGTAEAFLAGQKLVALNIEANKGNIASSRFKKGSKQLSGNWSGSSDICGITSGGFAARYKVNLKIRGHRYETTLSLMRAISGSEILGENTGMVSTTDKHVYFLGSDYWIDTEFDAANNILKGQLTTADDEKCELNLSRN